MSILKLTDSQIEQLKHGCPALSTIDLGSIINSIIDSVNAGQACGDIVDETTCVKLNKMCAFNGIALGDLLVSIIGASQTITDLDELENNQIKALNSTCNTLNGCDLGDKLNDIIVAINAQEPPVHVTSVSIPATLSLTDNESKSVSVTWQPADASDKTYTVVEADSDIVTIGTISETQFIVNGKKAGTTTVTLTPNDGGAQKAVSCEVTVTATETVE